MTPLAFRLRLLLFALCCGLCAWLGWTLRDLRAERAQQAREATLQRAHLQAIQAARNQDHGNVQAAVRTEQQRLRTTDRRDAHFTRLDQAIDSHAQNPAHLRGNADPEFVRIWREANAGSAASP